MTRTTQNIGHTFEIELPRKNQKSFWLTAEATLQFELKPGEPRVIYYKDGSGYPGSSDRAELCDLTVNRIMGEEDELERRDFPELFAYLDKTLRESQNASYWETLFFDKN